MSLQCNRYAPNSAKMSSPLDSGGGGQTEEMPQHSIRCNNAIQSHQVEPGFPGKKEKKSSLVPPYSFNHSIRFSLIFHYNITYSLPQVTTSLDWAVEQLAATDKALQGRSYAFGFPPPLFTCPGGSYQKGLPPWF